MERGGLQRLHRRELRHHEQELPVSEQRLRRHLRRSRRRPPGSRQLFQGRSRRIVGGDPVRENGRHRAPAAHPGRVRVRQRRRRRAHDGILRHTVSRQEGLRAGVSGEQGRRAPRHQVLRRASPVRAGRRARERFSALRFHVQGGARPRYRRAQGLQGAHERGTVFHCPGRIAHLRYRVRRRWKPRRAARQRGDGFPRVQRHMGQQGQERQYGRQGTRELHGRADGVRRRSGPVRRDR